MRTVVRALNMYMTPIPAIMTVVGDALENFDIPAMMRVGTSENRNARMTEEALPNIAKLLAVIASVAPNDAPDDTPVV